MPMTVSIMKMPAAKKGAPNQDIQPPPSRICSRSGGASWYDGFMLCISDGDVFTRLLQWVVARPPAFTLEARFHDFCQRCVHAVRLEGALRGCDHHIPNRPALRPDRSERLRQVDVHEAADGRAATAARVGGASAEAWRAASGSLRVRPVPGD